MSLTPPAGSAPPPGSSALSSRGVTPVESLDRLIEQLLPALSDSLRAEIRWTGRGFPALLRPDEQCVQLAVFRGASGRAFGSLSGRMFGLSGLIAATTQRALTVSEGVLKGSSIADFSYDTITAVESTNQFGYRTLKIHAASAVTRLQYVQPAPNAEALASYIRERIAAARPADADGRPELDVIDQLKRLGELRDAGTLTAEEFDRSKESLMARM